MKLTETSLRKLIKKILRESDHRWSRADDSLLMLDQEGMEKSDRQNVSRYLKSMRMLD